MNIMTGSSQGPPSIYEFLIFTRAGQCLFHHDFVEGKKSTTIAQRQKLIFGLIWSLKSFSSLMCGAEERAKQEFKSYTTISYKLHLFEIPTGLKLILLTKQTKDDLAHSLKHIFEKMYVPYVSKNTPFDSASEGAPIQSTKFIHAVLKYLSVITIS